MNNQEKLTEIRSLLDAGDLDGAQELIDEMNKEPETSEDEVVEEMKEESKEDETVEETSEDKEESAEDKEDESDKVDEQEKDEKGDNEEMEEKLEEQRSHEEVVKPTATQSEVRSFTKFVRSKGAETRGLTTVDAEAIIPVDIQTKARKLPETVVDLRNLVSQVTVSTGSGSYPILLPNQAVLTEVAELAKNPELANPEFDEVNYKVKTYRGQIPLSEESIQDSSAGDDNLIQIVADHIQRQGLNTTNAQIASKLRTATAKSVTDIDGIKDILNVEIEPAYAVQFICTQSFFNALDKMKDNDGRYLLQQDITSASGYKLLGREVVVLKDTLLGTKAGDKVAFVGDASAFITFFKRAETTARWVDHTIYGQLLAIFMRFDIQVVDQNAGFFVTLADPAPSE